MTSRRVLLQPRRKTFEPTPTRSEAHARLSVFLGEWSAEGRTEAVGNASAETMTHFHTYKWLPGQFHLYHSWEGHIGAHQSRGVEIIGFDAASGTYQFHFFDSDGWARVYEGHVRGNTWTLKGARERCGIAFSRDGKKMVIRWDRSPDGKTWEHLCDVCANKTSNA